MAQGGDSNKEFPLQGVILCCTSIPPEKRSDLAATASQMGAIHKLDLTSDVTHLIVGDTDTPKYKFVARERSDVKCLMPTWIDAVRDSWMGGGETEVALLEQQHQLPTFHGLRICVTGFEDAAYRKELEDSISENGGSYRANLTKEVTHLIAKEPSGMKYTYAGEWGIKIVSVEWLEQSIERGMILEETLFHLLLPASDRGRNAWIRKTSSASPLGKRTRDDAGPIPSRKLRRTASAKLNSQTSGLWTDIVAAGTANKGGQPDEWDDGHASNDAHTDPVESGPEGNPMAGLSITKVGTQAGNLSQMEKKSILDVSKPSLNAGMFQGKRFFVYGFNEKKLSVLKAHLLSHEAEIEEDLFQFCAKLSRDKVQCGYLLVPYGMLCSDVPKASQGSEYLRVVTDMWLERCLHSAECVDPRANPTSAPFRLHPIPGFESITICSTAFGGVDRLHLFKTVQLMGAQYDEFLTPNASVLVCNTLSPGLEKLKYAREWKVPTVSSKWLWDSVEEGRLKPFDLYFVGQPRNDVQDVDPKPSHDETEAGKVEKSSKLIAPTANENRERLFLGRSVNSTKDQENGQSSNKSKPRVIEESPIKKRKQHLDPIDTSDARTGIEILTTDEQQSNAIPPLRSISVPLKEISLNSSPKASPSSSPHKTVPSPSTKPTTSLKLNLPPNSDANTLGPAITSLLAHHQRLAAAAAAAASTSTTKPTDDPPTTTTNFPGRRRRQQTLLGRAPSNMSARSTNSLPQNNPLSRASSVDTMNTDGLGTPLEPPSTSTITSATFPFDLPPSTETQESEPQPQMTQLGYDDPDVRAWRERVVKKLELGAVGGHIELEKERRREGIGIVKDVLGKGARGVGRRTRQGGGR